MNRPFQALLLSALLFSTFATAQDLPEQQAFALQAAGDFRAAGDAYLALFASATGRPGDANTAALAEYAASKALDLERFAPLGPDIAARIAAGADSPLGRQHPLLADRLRMLAMTMMAYRGDPAAPALAVQCGLVGDVWLCGPFDNERGSGFRRSAGPEQGFALDAHYDGKRRPEAWRHVPVAAPDGRLMLGEVLRPSSQVMAYVAVAVIAQDDVDVALCLGSSGSWRVYLDGAVVGEREVQRRFAYDQDAVVLPLRRGPNLLMLQLCHQEGTSFGAAFRLRGLNGEALQGVRTSNVADDLVAATQVTARKALATAAPSLGARDTLLAAAGAGDGVAALRAAELLLLSHPDNDADARSRSMAEQAVQALPQCSEARLCLARARVRQIASKADRDENQRREDLAAVLQQQPDHVEALLELGWLEGAATDMQTRVEALAQQALKVAPECPLALALEASALAALGEKELALQETQRAAAAPHAPLMVWRRLANALDDADTVPALLAAWQRAAVLGYRSDRIALAKLLLRLGRQQEARELLQRCVDIEPWAREPRAILAEQLAASGELDQALQAWAQWLALCPEDDSALVALAALHRLQGNGEKQLQALREALQLNPNLRDVSRYIEFLAAETTPFYAAYELDGGKVLADDPGPPADAAEAKDAFQHPLMQKVVRAYRNGTTSEYLHLVIRVLTEEGCRRLQRFQLPYIGGDQRARMLSCVVHKQQGGVQHPRLAGGGVALAGLQPGDVVDLEGRVDDLAPSFFGDYFGLQHRFSAWDGMPTTHSQLVVIAEAGRDYQWQAQNGAPDPVIEKQPDGTTVYRWDMHQLPRDVSEPNRPSWQEREPLVRMTTYKSWDQFASWWWNLVERQLEVTPAMRQKVAELCNGLSDAEAKIGAIYRFVTTEVRYEAWEFGVHGYKPYSTAVIFERRHGDCKDKALLLSAMLGEIGVKAYPVLIHAAQQGRSQDDLSLPLVSHFNHCIAWMPAQDGRPAAFLDGTAVWHPMDTVPDMDQGARVLVVDAGKAELLDVPWVDPADNVTDDEFRAALRPDGGAEVGITMKPRGNEAIGLRIALGTETARRQETLERWLLPLLGKVSLRDITTSDAMRLDQPIELQATADVDTLATRQGGDLLLKDAFVRSNLLALTSELQRRSPLLLGAPSTDRQLVRYRLPAGFRPAAIPAPVQLDTSFGSFSLQWSRQGDELVARRELVLKSPRVQVADYGAFRDFAAAVKAADDQRVVARTQEGGR